jgi:hypothetical protein
MKLRTPLGSLATASLLALAIVSLPAGSAYATATNPKNKTATTCQAQGYEWDDVKGCADKTCTMYGETYHHGQFTNRGEDIVYCDGYTGNWVLIRTRPRSGPAAPRAGTTASP